jgi:hypothetical protein
MDRFFGSLKWTHELRQTIIKETGLPISFGLSANKTVAKVATGEAKPNGELYVEQPAIIPFLAPLSIRKIPMIGEKTYISLRNLGIDKVALLQQMPMEMLERCWVKTALRYGSGPVVSTTHLYTTTGNANPSAPNTPLSRTPSTLPASTTCSPPWWKAFATTCARKTNSQPALP